VSNFLAIATATATLRRELEGPVETEVDGATVTMTRPQGQPPQNPRVNVYLYHVTPNATWRNSDLPTRASDGRLVERPRAALDLHYILSFYGDEAELEPQRLLGSVVRTLHARPLLTRKMVSDTVGDPSFAYLASSNLADEVERVKLTPGVLSLDELTKLWSVFFQVPYALSVVYQASVVLIEPEVTPQRSLPVRERNVYAVPFRRPTIERVLSRSGGGEPESDQPILDDHSLVLEGTQLRGEVTRVRIADAEVEPQEIGEAQITLDLTQLIDINTQRPVELRAGARGVQVLQRVRMGTPPEPHRGFESSVAAFVLHPRITDEDWGTINWEADDKVNEKDTRKAAVPVQLSPGVGRRQRVVLLLNEFHPAASPERSARAYSFDAKARDADTNTVEFEARWVEPGDYLVSVQVDGAQSLHAVDAEPGSPTFNLYIAPRLTVPQ
jgi:hypothetical protein